MVSAADGPQLEVLVVEDNPGDALLIRETIAEARSASFAVTQVERLSDALDLLQNRNFDAVLLDLSLPDSCGMETLTRLLSSHPEPPPIVIMTGLDDEEVALVREFVSRSERGIIR